MRSKITKFSKKWCGHGGGGGGLGWWTRESKKPESGADMHRKVIIAETEG